MQKGKLIKEKIKKVAGKLFHENGYSNTSINDILDSSGIKKGSLYFHYSSKMQLFIDVLNDAKSNSDSYINSGTKSKTSTDQLIDVITRITEFYLKGDISKGCIFGNMALEIGRDGSELSQFIAHVFKNWEIRFKNHLLEAEKKGEIKLTEPATVLARMILASIQGGMLLSKISGSTKPIIDCTNFIKKVINDMKI